MTKPTESERCWGLLIPLRSEPSVSCRVRQPVAQQSPAERGQGQPCKRRAHTPGRGVSRLEMLLSGLTAYLT